MHVLDNTRVIYLQSYLIYFRSQIGIVYLMHFNSLSEMTTVKLRF